MFGKGHLEGQYRTKPVVSIRGATKYETKKELLERAHQERANREVKVILGLKKLKYLDFELYFNSLS